MATGRSFFTGFRYLGLLLLHLGCCFFTSSSCLRPRPDPVIGKKRRPSVSPPKSQRLLTLSPWPYLKSMFSVKLRKKNGIHDLPKSSSAAGEPHQPTNSPGSSSRSSQQSVIPIQTSSSSMAGLISPMKRSSGSCRESSLMVDLHARDNYGSFRNNIFPCSICGEIFSKMQILEQHQATKHAVSELIHGDSGRNIVQIIFQTSWFKKEKTPIVQRILKIHNSPKILNKFEEYRESVKLRAARNMNRRQERCVVDGNELLRFHCSTFTCSLGSDGSSRLCNQHFCSVCGIIRSGFSAKLDGISTWSSSWRAHESIPGDLEQEFAFMNVKRAMLVCRVIAGRIEYEHDQKVMNQMEESYDSMAGDNGAYVGLDELFVFNPKAVLPCFVIVYQSCS